MPSITCCDDLGPMAPNCIEDQSLKMIRNVSLNILNGNRIRGHTVCFHEFLFEKGSECPKDPTKLSKRTSKRVSLLNAVSTSVVSTYADFGLCTRSKGIPRYEVESLLGEQESVKSVSKRFLKRLSKRSSQIVSKRSSKRLSKMSFKCQSKKPSKFCQ